MIEAGTHILISRTDAIGDVVLTLPMAGYLKELIPGCRVSFLGRDYTQPVINTCTAVDSFISYNDIEVLPEREQVAFLKDKRIDIIIHVFPVKVIARLANLAQIKIRIGTTNRVYHWFTCNKLVKLSRKKSNLHEAQLNLILLKLLGLTNVQNLPEIIDHYCFENKAKLPVQLSDVLNQNKFNLVLHPKSHGSGVEWGLDKFKELISLLPQERFNIIITGSDKEKVLLKNWIDTLPDVVDLTGKMSLVQLIAFIFEADGLVASGTGPLHIAAASGIYTMGLFPSLRPIHAGRWGPLGKRAQYLTSNSGTLDSIIAEEVAKQIVEWKK